MKRRIGDCSTLSVGDVGGDVDGARALVANLFDRALNILAVPCLDTTRLPTLPPPVGHQADALEAPVITITCSRIGSSSIRHGLPSLPWLLQNGARIPGCDSPIAPCHLERFGRGLPYASAVCPVDVSLLTTAVVLTPETERHLCASPTRRIPQDHFGHPHAATRATTAFGLRRAGPARASSARPAETRSRSTSAACWRAGRRRASRCSPRA